MQKLIVALALSGAAAFVAPSAQRASLRVNAEEETAAPEPATTATAEARATATGQSLQGIELLLHNHRVPRRSLQPHVMVECPRHL